MLNSTKIILENYKGLLQNQKGREAEHDMVRTANIHIALCKPVICKY